MNTKRLGIMGLAVSIICASTLAAFGQSASTGGNVLRGGDFEDQPALLAWDQSSTTNE